MGHWRRVKRLFVLAGAAMALSVGCPQPAVAPSRAAIYVAVSGDDRAAGTIDAPLATIAHARDVARAMRTRGAGVTIVVRGGRYELAAPIALGHDDSGLTIEAQPGEHPVLSGGTRIAHFREATVNGRRAWLADVPGDRFRSLFVDGARRPRPRLPKRGFFQPAELLDVHPDRDPWNDGARSFRFAPGDLEGWANPTDIEVVTLHFWVDSRLPVESIDAAAHVVTFGRRSVFRLTESFEPQPLARYFVENVGEALDTPGEWYWNRATSALTYLPREEEDLARVEVVAPRIEQLIHIENADHVRIQGLELRDAAWELGDRVATPFPSDLSNAYQAAVNVGGAIVVRRSSDVTIAHCTIAHVDGYGIEITDGSSNVAVFACDIGDLGAGGLKIGEQKLSDAPTNHVTVRDCAIHDGGNIHRSAVGIWIGQSPYDVIAHDEIRDFDFTGISIGWTWGYGPSGAHDNLVDRNHIHHLGRGVLSDLAGVYTLGVSPGTIVRNNVIHDVTDKAYGGWGIYFDEGTTGVRAEGNAVYRTQTGAFFQNFGKDNVVTNNVFASSTEAQLMHGKPEGSFTIEKNIVYFRTGDLLGWSWTAGEFHFDHNVYWDAGGRAISFGGASFEAWRARGLDAHSVIADPMFVDPERGDFALRAGSPALAMGFVPLVVQDVGPATPPGAR